MMVISCKEKAEYMLKHISETAQVLMFHVTSGQKRPG